MQDLIFTPFQVRCPKCADFATVSLESLDDNEKVICPKCNFVYFPDIDVDKLLKLIRVVENSQLTPNNIN